MVDIVKSCPVKACDNLTLCESSIARLDELEVAELDSGECMWVPLRSTFTNRLGSSYAKKVCVSVSVVSTA